MDFDKLIRCIAGIAVLASILDIVIGDNSRVFGFRTVCGMAVAVSFIEAVHELLKQ